MVIGTVIGLVIGLMLGIFVSILINLPSSFHTGVGINNQVQVSGTVPNGTIGTLCFRNLNQTVETTAPITNGEYNVLLVGGQSYDIYLNWNPSSGEGLFTDFNTFYVPLSVTTLTENLVHS
jgi:hypothetical protein